MSFDITYLALSYRKLYSRLAIAIYLFFVNLCPLIWCPRTSASLMLHCLWLETNFWKLDWWLPTGGSWILM